MFVLLTLIPYLRYSVFFKKKNEQAVFCLISEIADMNVYIPHYMGKMNSRGILELLCIKRCVHCT